MSTNQAVARAVSARLTPDYATYAANPEGWLSIRGVPAEIAQRIQGFARCGIDPDQIVEAVRAAGPEAGPATPGWADTMAARGERAMAEGEAAERSGDAPGAKRSFLAASFWFFFARFPHILNAGGAAAYRRHNDAYARAARHFDPPLEIVRVPFGDGSFPALLRLPAGTTAPAPLVLLWGGIDVWKSDLEIHYLGEALLERGMATLALDMPGTGECPVPVDPAGDRVMRAALDHLEKDARIDGARIGAYGLSFGGHFAAKLALVEPRLKAVVQNAGPIHHTFAPAHIRRLPAGTRAALARVAGLDPAGDPAALATAHGALSLASQGLLPARGHAPLLSINGEQDIVVPIRDLHYLSEQGVRQDVLTFARDRHVASRHWPLHESLAAAWLARHLAA